VAESGILLRAVDVRKTYSSALGPIEAVAGVDFDLHPTELVSVFGPNGCGKSTLLNIIAGLDTADGAASVRVTNSLGIRPAFGIVVQNYGSSLMPWRSCLGNIVFPLEADRTLTPEDHSRRVQAALSALAVDLPLQRYPYELSGGQKQLTCIARALAAHPLVLLLDEPFSSLDFTTRLRMHQVIPEFCRRNVIGMLHVSHELDEAILTADRVLLLSRQPARIAGEFNVPLPWPRPASVMFDKKFSSIREDILSNMISQETRFA
jgi:NitT/TauT family transport system ATP-binding protein